MREVGEYGGTEEKDVAELLGSNDNVFSWDCRKIGGILREICSANFLNRTMSDELRCISTLYEILAEVVSGEKANQRSYVQRAMEAFQANLHRNTTVEQVAQNLGISRAYLRNIFYQEWGCSLREYRMRLKMERAEVHLQEEYTVTEVAGAVGYADVLQFSRIFKKYHGISPTQYRNGNATKT